MKNSNKSSLRKTSKWGTGRRLSRAVFKFFHNTKECEHNSTKATMSIEILNESSDENTVAAKTDSGLSQEPLIQNTSAFEHRQIKPLLQASKVLNECYGENSDVEKKDSGSSQEPLIQPKSNSSTTIEKTSEENIEECF